MRQSLQKTPPSGLSSAPARVPVGLLAAGAPRHGPRRNGRANGASGDAAVAPGSPGSSEALAARLRLMEGFISRTDIADCTQHALQWLAEAVGVHQSMCLGRAIREPGMTTAGAHHLPVEAAGVSGSVHAWDNPPA